MKGHAAQRLFPAVLAALLLGSSTYLLSPQTSLAQSATVKLYQQGLTDLDEGNYSAALKIFKDILTLYRQSNDVDGQREILINIGRTHERLGETSQALVAFNAALEITQQLQNPAQEGSILIKLAGVHELRGEYDRAHEHYSSALTVYRQSNNRRGEAAALTGQGLIALRQGKYTEALEQYQSALRVRRLEGDQYGEAITLSGLGVAYLQLGQPQKSLEVHRQALRLRKDAKNMQGKAISLRYIGQAYEALSRPRRALRHYRKALDISREIKDFNGQERSLIRMANLYNTTDQHSEALELLYKALALSQKISDRKGEGLVYDTIGQTQLLLGNAPEALQFYRYALALRQQIGDRAGEVETLSHLAELSAQQNKPETAVVFYKEAINRIEDIRKDLRTLTIAEQEAYTETVAHVYRSLADLLLSQERILEAQGVLELLKVQELRNFTDRNRTRNSEGIITYKRNFTNRTRTRNSRGIITYKSEAQVADSHDSLIEFGLAVKQCEETQCSLLSQKLDQLEEINSAFEQTLKALETEIRDRRANDFEFLDPTKIVRKAQEILDAQPNTVIVYPLVLKDKLWVLWAADGGITRSIEVPGIGQAEIGNAVVRFRQLLQTPTSNLDALQATGKQLYDWLLPAELTQELQANQIENLIFSLDNVTRYIPTDALFSGERYLIEDYNLSTIISAELTDTTSKLSPQADATNVLALGLSKPVAGFNSLPNVPDELDAIVRDAMKPEDPLGIYPGRELLDEQFTRRSMRDHLAGRQILHIATHGEFIPGNNAQSSYLLLGDGDKLPIADIERLRGLSQVHLVVLSACQTALGDSGQDGTEINGLSYYFLNGGAKAVIASLWNVNDQSTRALMEQFYTQLAQGEQMTKAQAMRSAKLKFIHAAGSSEAQGERGSIRVDSSGSATQSYFSHPYYWSPFIIIGNSR